MSSRTAATDAHAAAFLAPERCLVLEAHRETADTVTLTLETPARFGGAWLPGQFNMLYLFGLGEVPISIAGDIGVEGRLVHTIKAVGTVSRALTELRRGDHVWLRGPFGASWPELPRGTDLVLVAGGIGLAPLRPVLQQRIRGKEPGRTTLLYGSRTPDDLLYTGELATWGATSEAATSTVAGATRVLVTVDRVDSALAADWHGAVGVVTNLLQDLVLAPERTAAFTCGPEVMMRHVAAALANMGVDDDRIYVSVERNMKCAAGFCGRCQWGPHFVCRDGPVFRLRDVKRFWHVKEF